MGQVVTIGGNRIGSGSKMKTELKNYGRSTHNVSTKCRTTAAAGVLIPSVVLLATRGDKFEVKLSADLRTRPTVAPLFGSFKLQTDFFACPFRLYQGLLHNNPVELGRKMNQVLLPKLKIRTARTQGTDADEEEGKFAPNCLLKYCGMSGLGRGVRSYDYLERNIDAITSFAYMDIFKNYYANKQEENAYQITPITEQLAKYVIANESFMENYDSSHVNVTQVGENLYEIWYDYANNYLSGQTTPTITLAFEDEDFSQYTGAQKTAISNGIKITLFSRNENKPITRTLEEWNDSGVIFDIVWADSQIEIMLDDGNLQAELGALPTDYPTRLYIEPIYVTGSAKLNLQAFPLANIDKMRMQILSHNELGTRFVVERETAYPPYATLVQSDENGVTNNKYPMNGLLVKTYQSDIFNNWINSEWIDGENGISELTKIVTDEDGAFTIDQLQFARKLYNLYNRIAVSGATYYDWQNVVYEDSDYKHVESPVYVGGYSSEIVFDEIVQSTPTEDAPLGTLGGRGRLNGHNGGNFVIKCDEASFIIGITSITPRISYTQGNEFYMTELDSIDDLHKPELDAIGFQNLLGERMAYFDTVIAGNSIVHRSTIGKVPAWLEYMTNVDRTFGEFADKADYMVLTRKYDFETGYGIADATTYIDPSKFNYAFAYTGLDAQNFWLQINADIKKRGLISAKIIPSA